MHLLVLTLMLFHISAHGKELPVDSLLNLNRLLKEHDLDHDHKITIDDQKIKKDDSFDLELNSKELVKIQGVYFLSNLLQELKLVSDIPPKIDLLKSDRIFENPVDRYSRMIRELFWDGLTRRIDGQHLGKVLIDPKIQTKWKYLYVPAQDKIAVNYFQNIVKTKPQLKIKLMTVPSKVDIRFLEGLKNKHGLLTLALQKNAKDEWEGVPFVVPGGRFNEMYGWDSYFEMLGLLIDDRLDLAKGLVDNLVYEINFYGKILNANRSYYLARSQPPFLTRMIRNVFEAMKKDKSSKEWLRGAVKAAIQEYETIWMGKDHLTPMGLSRYYGYSPEVPPEVEKGHFDKIYAVYAQKKKMDLESYKKKYLEKKILEPELDEFFIHDQAVRESGHDTTYRWQKNDLDKCADFVTVDLNSLLYKYELDLAFIIKTEFQDKLDHFTSDYFYKKAKVRRELMRKFLWHDQGWFFDYDWVAQKPSKYISATAFYPLWASESSDPTTKILNKSEAKKLIENLEKELFVPGGIVASSLTSLKENGGKPHERQWDYPFGWAPHQMIAWEGLKNYQYEKMAEELIYRWLYMITTNAMDYNGTIPEKYDVVNRTHNVFAEYGNVGTKFSYITKEGFGWMNASYQLGLKYLSPELKQNLRSLKRP